MDSILYAANADRREMTGMPKFSCACCGRSLDSTKFVKEFDEANTRCEVCIDCMCQGIDNKRPSTFLHIFRHFDIPYYESMWARYSNTTFQKSPMTFGPTSVLGKYIRVMHMKQYKNRRFADSDPVAFSYDVLYRPQNLLDVWGPVEDRSALDDGIGEMPFPDADDETVWQQRAKRKMETKAEAEEKTDKIKSLIESGVPPEVAAASVSGMTAKSNIPPESVSRRETDRVIAAKKKDRELTVQKGSKEYKERGEQEPVRSIEPVVEEEDKDVVGGLSPQVSMAGFYDTPESLGLTDDDQRYLIGKWGAYYTPSQWVKMERMYNEYAQEYELTIDRAESLRKICATSIKMDEALETNDINTFKALASVSDQLRKSANLTDAQNKEKNERPFDSIGEIILMCEREGGPIPQFADPDEYPRDKIDQTLRDYKSYVSNLVRNELGLGAIIENFISKLEEAERKKEIEALKSEKDADDKTSEEIRQQIDYGIEREAESILRSIGEGLM